MMTSDILTHIPTGDTYTVYDITPTSFKSRDLPYDEQYINAGKSDYSLNGKPIELTEGLGSGRSSKGFIELNYKFV